MKTTKHILTGGPCSGKSSLIEELNKLGYTTIPEVARQVIEEQQTMPNPILPNTNYEKFQYIVGQKQIELEQQTENQNKQISFQDRSLIDVIGYQMLDNILPSKEIENHIKNTNYNKVFFCQVLDNYQNDNERHEDYKTAIKIEDALKTAYKQSGLKVIELTKEFNIPQRLEVILNSI